MLHSNIQILIPGMNREKIPKYYLLIFGSLTIVGNVGIYLFEELLWHPRNLPMELMISAIYISLGIVMLFAVKKPLKHKALVDFIILSNILHTLVMLIYQQSTFHMIDVVLIGVLGVVPLIIYPWGHRNFLRY